MLNKCWFCSFYYNCYNFECVESDVPLRHPRRAIKLATMYKVWYPLALGGTVLGGGLNDLGVMH